MKIQTLETKLQTWYEVAQVVMHKPDREIIARNYNKLNLQYMKKTGRTYEPK